MPREARCCGLAGNSLDQLPTITVAQFRPQAAQNHCYTAKVVTCRTSTPSNGTKWQPATSPITTGFHIRCKAVPLKCQQNHQQATQLSREFLQITLLQVLHLHVVFGERQVLIFAGGAELVRRDGVERESGSLGDEHREPGEAVAEGGSQQVADDARHVDVGDEDDVKLLEQLQLHQAPRRLAVRLRGSRL